MTGMILHRLVRWLSGSHDFLKWGAAGLLFGWSVLATAIAAIVNSRTSNATAGLVIVSIGLGLALLVLTGEWLWRVEERALTTSAERQERIAAKERVLGIGDTHAARLHSISRSHRELTQDREGTSRLVGRATIHVLHEVGRLPVEGRSR